MMMVEDGWRRAWERLEGGQRGFASAVRNAWDAQRREKTTLGLSLLVLIGPSELRENLTASVSNS